MAVGAPSETNPSDAKRQLREALQARRDALPLEERTAAANALAAHAGTLPVRPGTVVSAYWPMRSELDPRPLLSTLRAAGARIVLPALMPGRRLEFRAWSPGTRLVTAAFGTREPPPDAPVLDPEMLLVPLLAFTRRGDRLGYGAGYYDRALARLSARGATAIGLAFAAQEVAELPVEPHDRSLDAVLTERERIDCVPGRVTTCG